VSTVRVFVSVKAVSARTGDSRAAASARMAARFVRRVLIRWTGSLVDWSLGDWA
jgi:hypothetical protein